MEPQAQLPSQFQCSQRFGVITRQRVVGSVASDSNLVKDLLDLSGDQVL